MKQVFILFALAILPFMTSAQEKSEIDSLVNKLATYDMVTNYSSGIVGSVSEQYQIFMTLKKKASADQWLELTDHDSVIVRSYAYWALANHKEVDRRDVLEAHKDDNAEVTFLYGCVAQETTVVELMKRLNYTAMYDDLSGNYLVQPAMAQ